MDKVSRRRFLIGGAGVAGALALRPVLPAWAWNSSQSVAGGSLDTVPPEDVWDPAADAVVHRLFREEGITRIEELNALLRPWHQNAQSLPAGLPADLVAFIEDAKREPAWLDRQKLADGFDFYELRGSYTGLLYALGSGIMSCAIPDEARAVYHSKGGENMQDRVKKTAKLGYDVGTEHAFDPDGEMIVTCIKTRLTHSAVRYLITQSPRWQNGAAIPAPISQREPDDHLAQLGHLHPPDAGGMERRRHAHASGRIPACVAGHRALPRRRGRLHPRHLAGRCLSVGPDARPRARGDARGRLAGRHAVVDGRRRWPEPGCRERNGARTWSAPTRPVRASATCSRSPPIPPGTEASRPGGRGSWPAWNRAWASRAPTTCTGPSTN